VLGASAQMEEAGGQKWTVERVLQAHKEGIDLKEALEESTRRVLLRRELDKRLGDGKAKFNAKLLLEELPKVRWGLCALGGVRSQRQRALQHRVLLGGQLS